MNKNKNLSDYYFFNDYSKLQTSQLLEEKISVVNKFEDIKKSALANIENYEVLGKVSDIYNDYLDSTNSNNQANLMNIASLFNTFLSKSKLKAPQNHKIKDLKEGHIVLISDGKRESVMIMVSKNILNENKIEGMPILENTFYATNESVKILPKYNSLNTELALLQEYKFQFDYSLISLDGGFLGEVDLNCVNSESVKSKAFKKLDSLLDKREIERSKLLRILNYYSKIEINNKNNKNKLEDNILKVNSILTLERVNNE